MFTGNIARAYMAIWCS